MQLTGEEILSRGIVKNCSDEAKQQQGVDVRIGKISLVLGVGMVPAQGKTEPSWTTPITTCIYDNKEGYLLTSGYYEVELMEGVEVPDNCTLHFKTRSSLVRCRAIVHSGQFDAGFKTERAGCFLQVIGPVFIERRARIAQAIVFETNPVSNLYDGQWQGDRQRR